jgi:hypothetical protein
MMPGGARASSGNLSAKILDKRFNKILSNMHGIPVKTGEQNKKHNGVRSSSQENGHENGHQTGSHVHPRRKGGRRNKPDVEEQHV